MSSVPTIHEGSVYSKPLENVHSGGAAAVAGPKSGTVYGESPDESAIAELGSLISSLGSLAGQAQSLPLSPPSLPGAPQNQPYRPAATDYMQLAEDSN
jgi:hypothetical protein